MNIKKARQELGLTQKQLSDYLCLSGQERISEYETGKRNPSKRIIKLIELLLEGQKGDSK